MLGKTEPNPQLNIGDIPLIHFINSEHELCQLAKRIIWINEEKEFAGFYSHKGAPSIPMRIIIGLILLKKVYCFSDKKAIDQWIENPYWQHFCGEVYLQHKAPLHYSDFNHFRQRIGAEGEKMIVKLGIEVFGTSFTRGDQKRKGIAPKNLIARMINSFGNYLIRISC
jgi:transposase, IS5 family